MLIVGLTGGIACGKSTVSKLLQERGITVIDCDLIAFDVAQKGTWGYRRIISSFGRDILAADGSIDRVALGQLVFSDAAARRRLNRATHLPVAVELLRQLALCWLRLKPLVVVDMPLLFETGFNKFTSCNVVVACSPDVQLTRLMERDSSTAADAQARIDAQMSLAQKVQLAEYTLTNDGSVAELQQQVVNLLVTLKRRKGMKHVLISPLLVLGGVGVVLLARTAGWLRWPMF